MLDKANENNNAEEMAADFIGLITVLTPM